MNGRAAALDGVRGLLALAVVLSHVASFTWNGHAPTPAPLWAWTLWHWGAPAVDAFFVISGWVVSDSILRRQAQGGTYGSYLLARLRRLLPLSAVGIVLGLAVLRPLAASGEGHPVSALLTLPLRGSDLVGMASLGLLHFDANRVNLPLWSLTVEVQVALLMPLLTLAVTRGKWWSLLLLPALFCAVLYGGPLVFSLWYVPAFMLGIAIRTVRVPQGWAWALLVAGALLWQHRLVTGESLYYRHTASLGAAAALVGLMSLPVSAWLRRVLEGRACLWLGQVSFALYATHLLPLLIGAALTPAQPSLGAALGVPFTLLLAWGVYRGIERPLMLK